MKTALLIDGSDEPTGMQLDPRDFDRSKPYITWATSGQSPRSFKFIREEGDVMLFRLATGSITDEHFEKVAAAEVHKIHHPELYFDRVLYPEMYTRPALRGAHPLGRAL